MALLVFPIQVAQLRSSLDRVLARGLDPDPSVRAATVERFTDAFAHAARSAPLTTALTGRETQRPSLIEVTTPPLRRRSGETTPPPLVRRTERRVTTALVWNANRGTRDTEIAERMVLDAGGNPIRVASGDIIALFGATRSMGERCRARGPRGPRAGREVRRSRWTRHDKDPATPDG